MTCANRPSSCGNTRGSPSAGFWKTRAASAATRRVRRPAHHLHAGRRRRRARLAVAGGPRRRLSWETQGAPTGAACFGQVWCSCATRERRFWCRAFPNLAHSLRLASVRVRAVAVFDGPVGATTRLCLVPLARFACERCRDHEGARGCRAPQLIYVPLCLPPALSPRRGGRCYTTCASQMRSAVA
jgi:hypothetical protein